MVFVRNPLGWYQSYWADRQLAGWGGDLLLGHNCQLDDFGDFIRCTTLHHPAFLKGYFGRYTKDHVMVGKQENLVADLLKFLVDVGEEPNASAVLQLERVNLCASRPRLAERCEYTPETRKLVAESEQEVFEMFDYPTD